MKIWIGKWMMTVAILHVAFGFYNYSSQFQAILAEGVLGAAKSPDTKLAIWFVLFGLVFFALGQIVNHLEAMSQNFPRSFVATLLFTVIIGVMLIPTSGFWLLFPPTLALLFNKKS